MKTQLDSLRKQIDGIDESIVNLLAERMKVVKKVGEYKKTNNIPSFDKKRWQEILKSKRGYIKKIWKTIHNEALKIEKLL